MIHLTAHGRIGRDAELRHTPDGTAVCDIAIACNYGRKGEDGKKPTQWLRASMWGKQAESLAEYLTKGKGVVVIVEDAHIREFKKADGSSASSLEGRVISFEFTGVGPREEGAAPAPPARPAAQQRPAASRQAPARPATSFDDMDDDVPF